MVRRERVAAAQSERPSPVSLFEVAIFKYGTYHHIAVPKNEVAMAAGGFMRSDKEELSRDRN